MLIYENFNDEFMQICLNLNLDHFSVHDTMLRPALRVTRPFPDEMLTS